MRFGGFYRNSVLNIKKEREREKRRLAYTRCSSRGSRNRHAVWLLGEDQPASVRAEQLARQIPYPLPQVAVPGSGQDSPNQHRAISSLRQKAQEEN